MSTEKYHSDYINGIRIDESFGKYRLSCKVGTYCEFGFDQISNQSHHHDCYELCTVINGNGYFIYNDEANKITKGDIMITDPDCNHEIRSKVNDNLVLLYIFITLDENQRISALRTYEDEVIENFLSGHNCVAAKENLLSYIRFIEDYNSPGTKNPYGTIQALKALIIESLSEFSHSRVIQNKISGHANTFETALDFIDANLHTKILAIEVAENSLTSLRNLEYIFKKNLNKTVKEYINEKKCDLACHYLKMYYGVSQTAQMIGIGNISQFCSMFKKHKGISPVEYRTKNTGNGRGMGRRI